MDVLKFSPCCSTICADFSDYREMIYESHEWLYLIYGNIEEELPLDMPIPLGKIEQASLFFDANFYHNLVMGCTLTGILYPVNQTPIDWHCKAGHCSYSYICLSNLLCE